MKSFKAKNEFKHYKVLRGLICASNMQNFSNSLFCMLSNSMVKCGMNFLNILYDTQVNLFLNCASNSFHSLFMILVVTAVALHEVDGVV